jgi:hypothetical protein
MTTMDMPTPSIGSSQYALTKPGRFRDHIQPPACQCLAGHFCVLDAAAGYPACIGRVFRAP